MNQFKVKILLASTLIAGALHAKEITIDTNINIDQLAENLSLDEKLNILKIGLVKKLQMQFEKAAQEAIEFSRTHKIEKKLRKCEACITEAYEKMVARAQERGEPVVDEVAFKQKFVLSIYAALYKMAEQEIADEGSEEQEIIFTQQLTPEQITELFAEE